MPGNYQSQKGMSLVEAMVTLTLTATIGLGMAFLSGRSAIAQKDMNVLGLTVGQMRNQIMSENCSATNNVQLTLTVGSNNIRASCQSQATAVRITSTNESFQPAQVQVAIPGIATGSDSTSRTLFGGPVTMDTR